MQNWKEPDRTMTIKQLYEAYRAEAEKHAPLHVAALREMISREQELYDAWQAAIAACNTWTNGTRTWHILERSQDGDLEMWRCCVSEPGKPDEEADCYAAYVRMDAWPVDEEQAK